MWTLTDNILQNYQSPELKVKPRVRIQKKDEGTNTEKMDVNMLSASDEFFIEFELNKKYHNSIDELRQMKHNLQMLEETAPSDAVSTMRALGDKMNGDVQKV